jgi:hypothetical protein
MLCESALPVKVIAGDGDYLVVGALAFCGVRIVITFRRVLFIIGKWF